MQTCPGPTDGPSIIVNAVEEARRVLAADPSATPPPACVVGAFARIDGYLPDSLVDHASALASEIRRRGGTQQDLLASEVLLFVRARRYAEVLPTYDRLTAIDSNPAMDVMRVAISAAWQQRDTIRLTRILTRASARAGAPPAMRNELNVLRQVGALRAAIDESRGLVRQNPKYLAAYPSLIGNFGTLGRADSVRSYIQRALGQGAARATLQTSVDPFVNTMLRQAALYPTVFLGETAIASASRVDSALSTTSTKFMVASLIAQSAEPEIAEINALVSGSSWLTRGMGTTTAAAPTNRARADACRRIPPILARLGVAEQRLREGGDRFPGAGTAQIRAGVSSERDRLTLLQDICSRAGPG
jgi:hypothetical protein